jgi:hypothetical protein
MPKNFPVFREPAILFRQLCLMLVIDIGSQAAAQTVQTYCSNVGGNIACTSYDNATSSQSYCTSIGGNLSCTTYSNTNDYSRVQVQQNYEAGKAIGTALGNLISAAIEQHRANKQLLRDRQDQWNQWVQDMISSKEIDCEANPSESNLKTPEDCRRSIYVLNQFLHRHRKDFVFDGNNFGLLLARMDESTTMTWTEEIWETAFAAVDKHDLDKHCYLGLNKSDPRHKMRCENSF